MKTICAAVRQDYDPNTSYNDAKITRERSICKQNVQLIYISETAVGEGERYHAALCYVSESLTRCIIDGRNDDLVDLFYRKTDEKCIYDLSANTIQKQTYLKKGSSLLTRPKKGFLDAILSFFCCFKI